MRSADDVPLPVFVQVEVHDWHRVGRDAAMNAIKDHFTAYRAANPQKEGRERGLRLSMIGQDRTCWC